MSVDWDNVSGAAYYLVRWRLAGSGSKLNEGVEAQSSGTDITVDEYGEWVVRVEACNSAGCGDHLAKRFKVESATETTPVAPTSTSTPETTPTPTPEPVIEIPDKPTGLRADTALDSLNVSMDWDDVDGATHYLVRWRLAGSGDKLNEGVEVQSSDGNITVDEYGEWVVRVEACNSAGCGDHLAKRFKAESATETTPVAPLSTSTPETTPTPTPEPVTELPDKPTGLGVDTVPGSLDVSVDWDDVDGATHYLVRWRAAGPGNKLNEGVLPQSSDTVITVTDFGDWVVRVEACNDAGCGPPLARRFEVEPAPEPTPALEETATSTPATSATTTPPFFPFAISGLFLEEPGDIGDVALPEAEGGDGEFTYSLTGLPEGLSFDPASRILSGTLAETGEHIMTYTVTDGAGSQASFSLTITVGSALRTAKSLDWRLPDVKNITVVRKQYSEPASPAFDVSWGAPDSTSSFYPNRVLTVKQYNVRYTKHGTGRWTHVGVKKGTTSAVLTPLEAGARYRVDVQVAYTDGGLTEWRTPHYEGHLANRTPRLAAGSLSPSYLLELGGTDSVTTISDKFTEPDGDALTYSVSSSPPGIVTATIEDGDNSAKKLRIRVVNPALTNVIYGAHDGYGGYVSQVISVGGFASLTRSVDENSEAGAAVGAAVTGTPHGSETLYYTLTGEAATSEAFEIDSSTGQISVAEGASLDYETKSSYTGKVKWTVQGAAAEFNLTINVTDVKEVPLAPVNPQVTDITDTSFTVTWEAPDNTGRPAITEYELESTAPGLTRGNIGGTTHSVSYSSLVPGTTYSFTLKARNTDGDGAEVAFAATTPDYRPRSTDFTKYFREGENAFFSQSDFPFSSDEEDDVLASVKFTSIPTAEGRFYRRLTGGQSHISKGVGENQPVAASDLDRLRFVPKTTFDGTATAEFKVIDQEGDESESAYTLTLLTAVNIPPSFSTSGSLSREVPENSASGTAVGAAVTATDRDTEDTLTYSLSGVDASSFTIASTTGQISVASGTVLDYEAAKNTYEVRVEVSDGKDNDGAADGSVDTFVTVNIAVTNVNEGAPPSVSFSISEVGATTMKVTVTPPDTTGTSPIKHYTVAYKAGSDFDILASPAESDGSVTLDSGTTVTLTGLTPSTTYYVKVVARNLDDQDGPEPTAQTADTGTNTAPTSANFTKKVYRFSDLTFSKSDFPFTDPDPGDAFHQVKVVTLPGVTADWNGKRPGELRFDGVAATVGQLVSVDDLGKLKYVPQPNGFRLTIGSSFTFKVLDRDGAESPTYTAKLEQGPDLTLSLSPGSITESATPNAGGRVTVTGTLTGPARSSATVISEIRVDTDHDARQNSDYTVNTIAQQLTIPAGQKGATLTFDFTGIEDSLVEGDEKIKFYPVWKNGQSTTSDKEWVYPVYLTLTDNDRSVVSISGPPGEVEEGENAVFTVSLSRGITRPLSVAWSASSGTASSDDFVASSGTVTFPTGSPDNATQTITIPVTDDLAPEPTERFSVALGAITGKPASQVSIALGQGTAGADIAESDPVTVSVSGDARVIEGASATYTISLDSSASTDAITVDYATSDFTAEAGADYTAASGTVTIPAGDTSATVTVATTDNTDDEANRYFEFRMSNPQGGGGPTPLMSTTQFVNTVIVDNDGDPSSVVLSVNKTTFGESDAAGAVNVTATLEGGTLTEDATVAVTLAGSATKGSSGDYTATTLGNITITGGETSGTASFTVTPVGDTVVEGDETILVQGASAGLDVTPATITITDDDTATLGITGPAGLVAEGGSAQFTVTLSHEAAAQVVVAWSAGSTAEVPASADDYAPDSGTVIFPAGSAAGATKTITMTIADDGTDEQQETFTVTLGSATGDLASRVSVDSAKSSADASIATGEIVTVTLMGPRKFAYETEAHFAVYHVFLSGPVDTDIMVDVATSDGTATAGSDYTSVSNTLTIGPSKDTEHNTRKFGVTWDTVFLHLKGYPRTDPDETFTISLSNLRGGGTTPVVLGNSSVTTTITSTPLAFSVSGPEFVDEGTKARFIVTRNVDLHPTVGARVSYTTSDGTATAGTDYTAVSGTLEMPISTNPPSSGDYQQRYSDWEVLVPVKADNTDEDGETFSLVISNPVFTNFDGDETASAALGTATAETTIRDRAMVVSVSGPETVVEGQNADFTVTLSRAPTANLTVNYQTYTALAPLPPATSGADYTPQSGTLTFVPGETSKRVRVPILTDATRERIEYFRLLLSGPSGGGGRTPTLGTSAATMGIVDAAGPLYGATVTLTPASNIDEGDTSATNFTVKVDLDCCTTFEDPITVTVSLGGTATVTDDYTATTANVTIPASTATATTTLSITPVEDAIVEGAETIVVNGSAPGLAIIPATVTLIDNDMAGIILSVNPEYVQEGQHAARVTLTATRDGTSGDHTVTLLVGDGGTATDGIDYTIWTFNPALRIAPGESSASMTLTFTVFADGEDEGNETVILSGTVPGATVSDAVVTIGQPETIALSVAPSSISEDANATEVTVTATLSAARDADTVVNLTLGGTAADPADYTATSLASITIPKGQTSGSGKLTITPVDDTAPEGDETIAVSGESGARPVSPAEITITDDEDPAAITLSVNPEYIQEGQYAANVVVTATRDGTEGDHTVTLSVSEDGTATAGIDYTIWALYDIRIAPGESSASTALTFTVVDDNAVHTDDGNESVILSGTAPGAAVSDAVVTIGQPETIALSVDPDTIAEDAGATEVTVTATMSEARAADTVVDLTLGGTAAAPADYTATSLASITIPKGQTTAGGTLTITPVDDTAPAGDKTITVSGESGSRTVSPADITIDDDEIAAITLSVNPEYVQEGQVAARVTVTATRDGTEGDHTVTLSVGGGTATDGTDYTIWALYDIRIAPGESSASTALTFTVNTDNLDEGNETVILSGTAPGAVVSDAVVTIGQPESIALSVAPLSISEDAGETEVTVTATMSEARDTGTVVNLTFGGTATDPADYTATSLASITIPTGATSTTGMLTITPVDDTAIEGDETITVSGESGARPVSPSAITITLIDNDAPIISFQTAPTNVDEGETATYVVKLEGARTTNVTVDFATGADGDLATAGQDYTAVSRTLTFSPTDTTKTVTVRTTADNRFEVTEDFTVSLSNAQGGGGLTPVISKGNRTTTITDNFKDQDEYPDSYTLSAAPTTLGEGDGATQITFTATLSGKSVFPVPVDVLVHVADSRPGGTAALNEDFTVSGSHGQFLVITIPPNQSSATGTLTLTPLDDSEVEGAETAVFASIGAAGLRTLDRPAITITDNDTAPTSITLDASPRVLREGTKTVNDVRVTATLDGSSTLTIQTVVTVLLADGTAKAGSDYSAATATVTIPAGESSGSTALKVPVIDDKTDEPAEYLSVAGTAPGFTVSPVDLIILDDDGSATGIVLHARPSTVREDAGATAVTVTAAFRSGTPQANETVIDLSLADGTATLAGEDYSTATGTVTIPAGQLYGTGTFTFTPKPDSIVEPDETVLLQGSAKEFTVTPPATITIVDSTLADLSISGPSEEVEEGSSATFTVTLSAAIAADLSVNWFATPNTAVAADYSPISGSVTFPADSPAGATTAITVRVKDDALSETAERFTVTLGAVGGQLSSQVSVASSASSAQVTIAESDPIKVELVGPVIVDEGLDAVFTISLSPANVRPTEDLIVSYATADGTAKAGLDYVSASGAATFTETAAEPRTFTVRTVKDSVDEGAGETFFASLIGLQGGGGPDPGLGTGTVSTTIAEPGSSDIILRADPGAVLENAGSADITIKAIYREGTTSSASTTVTIALGGSAGNPADYTVTTALASIVIPAGEISAEGTLTIAPVSDSLAEGSETITVSGQSGSLTVIPVDIAIVDPVPSTAITLGVNPEYLEEGQAAAQVILTATRDGNVGRHKVDLELSSSSTATDGEDYTLWSLTLHELVIEPGKTSASVPLVFTVHDDGEDEENETIVISGSTEGGLSVSDAVIVIGEPEDITLSVSPDSIAESAGPTEVTVTATMSAARTAGTTVNITLSGTAENPADYAATALGSITIAQGQTSATSTLTITPVDDDVVEGVETITVSGASGSRQVSPADITITDDDTAPTGITLSVSPVTVGEGDGQTDVTVTATLVGDSTLSTNTTVSLSLGGTANDPADYDVTTALASVTIPARQASVERTLTITPVDDSLAEGDETITVTGTASGFTVSGTATTITITDNDALTGIALSVEPASLGEDDGETEVTVTATLEGGTTRSEATVVTIGMLGGTATSSDYTATKPASITIPTGVGSATSTLTITPVDDTVVEGDETIVLSGTTSVSLNVSPATITITDGDGGTPGNPNDVDTADLSISGPSGEVSEGGSAVFIVTLSKQVAAGVTVSWSATAGTAESSDYGTSSGTVTFPANSAAGATSTVSVSVTDDDLSETAESFTVTLGTVGGDLSSQISLKSGSSGAQATIDESDPITVSITGPSSVDEGDATTAYTVSLSPSGVTPTANLTVDYATADGTATADTDYTAKSGTLTFTQSDHADKTFTVQTTADTFDEGAGETFTVTLSNQSGGGGPAPSLGTDKSVTTTITDDDDAISGITLSVSPTSVGEDDGKTEFTVTASLGDTTTLPTDTEVTLTLGGTAGPSDYTVNTALASITIVSNTASATGTLELTPTDDATVEGDETIVVSGTATDLEVSDATITINDHNGTTTGDPNDKDSAELSITGPASVDEGSDATFTVTLSAAVSKEVTVAWSAAGNTDDYSPDSGTVTFAAGSAAGATQDIDITVTDDDLSETAESFTVTLGTVGGDLSSQISLKSGADSATATISESDAITVELSGPSSVNEGDTTTNYTVSLSPSGVTPTANLTVDYATADGTATADTDYTAKSGTLTFTKTAAGPQTFTVQTTADTFDEGAGETFTVTLSNQSGGGGPAPSLGTDKSVTTTITDDDAAISGITLSVSPMSVGEDDGKTEFTVTASLGDTTTLPTDTEVTLTLGGTAGSSDYTVNTALTSITIVSNTASATGTLELTPTDDATVEGDETIVVSGTATDLEVSDATITINDHNGTTTGDPNDKDSAEVSITGPASVDEGSDATFTVTLSAAVSKEVTVAWSAAGNTDDYSPDSGTVTFAAGSAAGATQDIDITVTDDDLSETAESFTVTLGTVGGDLSSQVSLKSGAGSASATISESDAITVSISGPSSVEEGDATTAYTVSLSGGTPSEDLTVDYATSDGTATADTDYTAKSGTLTFTKTAAGPQTFTVSTTEDGVDEGTGETFTVTLSNQSGGGGPAASLDSNKTSVETTITDDDDAPSGIALSASPNSLGEDDAATSVTVTAALDGSTLPSDTVVTIGTLFGSATKGTDYTATSLASITIPANSESASGTLTITPEDDLEVEGDETIMIPGTTTVSGLTVTSATITLTDDDKTTTDDDDKDSAELSIAGPTSNVAEGDVAEFTVTLSAAVSKEVTVAWTAPLGTDSAEEADLSATSGTVTFAANSTAGATQSITITATDDKLSETAESFTVTLGTITSTLSGQLLLKNGASSAQATITASDPITVSISGPSSVDEGDATTAYTVSLSPSGVTPDG